MHSYPILRSGFVGLSSTGLVQPSSTNNAIAAALLNKQTLQPDNNYFYHETLQSLYLKTIEGVTSNILGKIDFQEEIITAAAEAFGTRNIWDWIVHQFANGSITGLHAAFLKETLNFVSGAERKTRPEQWIRLLEATTEHSLIVTQNSNDYLGLNELRSTRIIPARLDQFFVQWIRQPNGIYDFVVSLEVIFGNRRLLQRGS